MKDEGISSRAILLEPILRDTCAAITAAVLHIQASDPEALILVLPSDHVIKNTETYLSAVERAKEAAIHGHIVTFGVVASSPDTAFGYVKAGMEIDNLSHTFHVDQFVEKPDIETAQKYLKSGE